MNMTHSSPYLQPCLMKEPRPQSNKQLCKQDQHEAQRRGRIETIPSFDSLQAQARDQEDHDDRQVRRRHPERLLGFKVSAWTRIHQCERNHLRKNQLCQKVRPCKGLWSSNCPHFFSARCFCSFMSVLAAISSGKKPPISCVIFPRTEAVLSRQWLGCE